MKTPEVVNRRKSALITELGHDPALVIEYSFDVSGFTLLGDDPRGIPTFRSDEPVTTRIEWPTDKYRQRAAAALEEDFAEMIGKTPDEWRREKLLLDGIATRATTNRSKRRPKCVTIRCLASL